MKALILFGNNWKKVQTYVTTRSPSQARSHAQKYFIRIKNKILKDFKRATIKLINDVDLSNWISRYINDEVTLGAEDNLSNKTENLKKVLLHMCKNSSRVRKSSNGSEYVDNYFIKDVDDYFKNIEYDEKKQNVFKIEKVGKPQNSSQSNQSVIQSHVFNQPVNSYINIVTINVCKNENKEEEVNPDNNDLINNQFYYNFRNEKNRFKVTHHDLDKKPEDEKTNTAFNLNFDYDDFNNIDKIEEDYNHFDLDQFFNSY
jgi:hypothetical protein